MKEIILAMMLWIHNATGYTIPEIPDIRYLSTMDIRAYAYGCDQVPIPNGNEDICEARENWDIDYRGPIALYDHIDKVVILNKDFDITTVHDQSVLFHELVHHLQYANDIDSTVKCNGELEKEAYTLQDEWLHEKYGLNVWDTIQINQLFFMLITSCMTDMHVPDPEYNQ